ncbi:MAG: nucleotidyltransferase family protein [Phycisphaerae bacterium]|jgi:hypothetical protein
MFSIPVSIEALSALCRQHHVRELAVFGSTARGVARLDSDIDLLVEFEPTARVGFLALAQLAEELERLLGRKVDLVPKDGLKPRIREAILREAEVLFAA